MKNAYDFENVEFLLVFRLPIPKQVVKYNNADLKVEISNLIIITLHVPLVSFYFTSTRSKKIRLELCLKGREGYILQWM